MAQHNFSTVFNFEIRRALSKKLFWISALLVPIFALVVMFLVILSNTNSNSADSNKGTFSIQYTDASGLITDQIAESFGAVKASSPEDGLEAVKAKSVDAYFEFPATMSSTAVKVSAVDEGIFANNKYPAVAKAMVKAAASAQLGPSEATQLLAAGADVDLSTYKGGTKTGGIGEVLPPLIYLVIFYFLVLSLMTPMLNSTMEEKENRVTEMIFTSIQPQTLLRSKLCSLLVVGLIQLAIMVLPLIVVYVVAKDTVKLPQFDLSKLTFAPEPMLMGVALLLAGFLLFMVTLLTIGAIAPNAKETGPFIGPFMVLLFAPFWIFSMILSSPESLLVQVFTYFPFTAPVTAMLRNGLGTLSLLEGSIVLVILLLTTAVIFKIGSKIFQQGALEYSKKVSLRSILATKS